MRRSKKYVKVYRWFFFTYILWFGLVGLAMADSYPECDVLIEGTDNPETDVPVLQEALNAGGTVCVSGTLGFESTLPPASLPGECNVPNLSQVCIDPDPGVTYVRLVGVDDRYGKAAFDGGYNTIFVPANADVESIWIDNLRGVEPTESFVLSFHGDGDLFKVTNVDVEGVIPAVFGGVPYVQVGMQVSSYSEDVEATVIFENNTIEGAVSNIVPLIAPVGIAAYGRFAQFQQGEWTGRLVVRDNRTTNWAANGIAALVVADAVIEGNVVQTGSRAHAAPVGGLSPCSSDAGLGYASGIAVRGQGSAELIDNRVIIEPATTAFGDIRCQAGVLFVEVEELMVEDLTVQASATNAQGIVVVESSDIDVQDFRIKGAGVGISTIGSDNITYIDGRIASTVACIAETDSTNISYTDITCR